MNDASTVASEPVPGVVDAESAALETVLEEVSGLDAGDLDAHLPAFEKAHAALRAALTQGPNRMAPDGAT